jgi:hypothetical protein
MQPGVVATVPGVALEVTADVQAGRGGQAAQRGGQAGRRRPMTVGPARTAVADPGGFTVWRVVCRVQRAG